MPESFAADCPLLQSVSLPGIMYKNYPVLINIPAISHSNIW